MFTKLLTKFVPVLVLSTLTTVSQAAIISFSGTLESASGAFGSLFPVGPFLDGSLNYDTHLNAGSVTIGGVCFTSDVSGLPPTGPSCASSPTSSPAPILATGQTSYDGSPAPFGATFEQGTTLDGASGVLEILGFSPAFNVGIFITLDFAADGTGTMFMSEMDLGTVSGDFTWTTSAVPVPAAAWLFGSALVGLVGLKRRK